MLDRVAELLYLITVNIPEARWGCVDPHMKETVWKPRAKELIQALREPNHAITRAMAESRATDDEGQFEIMLDLLDFSGENKTHTVLAQAWRDGIDAILREG